MDIYTKDAINNKLTKKQDTLVSGTNIKTINGNSLLGSGDVTISGSGGASVEPADYASANKQLNGLNINGTDFKLLDVKVNNGTSLIIGNNRELASGATGATAIGACSSSTASSDNSIALGYDASASGGNSIALGYYSNASVSHSTAIGNYSTASGTYAIAIGNSSVASGSYSTALGYHSNSMGRNSTALGYYSVADGRNSITIGYSSKVYVPNQVSFDGTTNDLVRTVALKSTDNIFFRNENIDSTKTTQASYINGKTLTEVLNEKQDTLVSGANIKTINGNSMLGSGDLTISGSGTQGDKLVRINITNISDAATGVNDNKLVFVGYHDLINSALEDLGLDLETLSSNWQALMAGENATQIWDGLRVFLLYGACFGCFYTIGGDIETQETVSAIVKSNYLGYIVLSGTTPEGHVVFNTETAMKTAFANSVMHLDD